MRGLCGSGPPRDDAPDRSRTSSSSPPQLEAPDRAVAHVLESQRSRRASARFVRDRADQARATFAGERKDRQKVGLVEIDVQFAVDRAAPRPRRRRRRKAARKSRPESRRPSFRVRASARRRSRRCRRPRIVSSPWSAWRTRGDHTAAIIRNRRLPSVARPKPLRLQPRDQQPLVLVLRENAQIRVRGHPDADLLEVYARLALAARPKIDRGNLMRPLRQRRRRDRAAGRARASGPERERARGRPRLGGLVHDPHFTPSLVSQSARTRPVGPAPTIRTSQAFMSGSLSPAQRNQNRPQRNQNPAQQNPSRTQQKQSRAQRNPRDDSDPFPATDRGFSMACARMAAGSSFAAPGGRQVAATTGTLAHVSDYHK